MEQTLLGLPRYVVCEQSGENLTARQPLLALPKRWDWTRPPSSSVSTRTVSKEIEQDYKDGVALGVTAPSAS
jgi:hypothetical protein